MCNGTIFFIIRVEILGQKILYLGMKAAKRAYIVLPRDMGTAKMSPRHQKGLFLQQSCTVNWTARTLPFPGSGVVISIIKST